MRFKIVDNVVNHGAVQTGKIDEWFGWEIVKYAKNADGKIKTYYDVVIDGDNQHCEFTLKEARDYVNELKEGWK